MAQNEYNNNVRAYKILFKLERSLRKFISSELQKNLQLNWLKAISKVIIKKCEKRAKRESETYQDITVEDADHILNYSDFKDIKDIIIDNWSIFGTCFIRKDLIENKLEELEIPRNVIAHNRIISNNELSRISVYANDLERCINRFRQNST